MSDDFRKTLCKQSNAHFSFKYWNKGVKRFVQINDPLMMGVNGTKRQVSPFEYCLDSVDQMIRFFKMQIHFTDQDKIEMAKNLCRSLGAKDD